MVFGPLAKPVEKVAISSKEGADRGGSVKKVVVLSTWGVVPLGGNRGEAPF